MIDVSTTAETTELAAGRLGRPRRKIGGLRSSLIGAMAAAVGVLVLTILLVADPIVEISVPPSSLGAARAVVGELLLIAGIMAVAVTLLLTLILSRTIVEPIRALTEAADVLATGDLSKRIHSARHDELGTLGDALDRMADRLEEQVHTLRTEEARLRAVLDSMVEAVFVTDQQRRVVLTNKALAHLLGRDITGETVRDSLPYPMLRAAVRRAREGQVTKVSLELDHGDLARSLQAQLAPLPEGSGVVAVLHDVTEIKRADAIRRDFVANASHELRTPLTAVRGFTETLLDGALSDPQSARRFVEVILKNTLRLQRLVDDLLTLSRSEVPNIRLQRQPVEVVAVAREVIASLETQGATKGLRIRYDDTSDSVAWAYANEDAVHQVLVNFIDNAIKYTPEGGAVTVQAHDDGDRVVLRVRDSGPGIAPVHQRRIFERFYRVDAARSRDVGGTGLGLAIVKHLASRMGAEVGVHSEPGAGATFWVSLRRLRR